MTITEFAGYLAAFLVFLSFYMNTMVPLRVAGICSNCAFIVYGYLGERSRRMHGNDIENIPLFLIAGLLYVCTGPNEIVALALFAIYLLSRLVHFYVVMTARFARRPRHVLDDWLRRLVHHGWRDPLAGLAILVRRPVTSSSSRRFPRCRAIVSPRADWRYRRGPCIDTE